MLDNAHVHVSPNYLLFNSIMCERRFSIVAGKGGASQILRPDFQVLVATYLAAARTIRTVLVCRLTVHSVAEQKKSLDLV